MSNPRQQISAAAFKALHADPAGFILPNAWDAGSAILLAEVGFPALATTSAGVAFSRGRPDYSVGDSRMAVGRDEMLDRLAEIAQAVTVPVSGDLEAGYGETADAVAETIRRAIAAGLAGGNIEDADPLTSGALYDEDRAVARIAAARAAIGANPFVLNARTDVFLQGGDMASAIRRANRFLEAGADCVFTPGAPDLPTIETLAREIDGPLNVVMGLGTAPSDAKALFAAGVRRISLGGTFARAALAFIRKGAEELRDHGTIGFAAAQTPQGELNALFARARSLTPLPAS